MSQETFDENQQAIGAGIMALWANPRSRKLFRRAALYERQTGELIAEVFGTQYGPVVHYSASTSALKYMNGNEVRQSRGAFVLDPLTGEPEQEFRAMSRSRHYRIAGSDFAAWLSEGVEEFRHHGGELTFGKARRVAQRK